MKNLLLSRCALLALVLSVGVSCRESFLDFTPQDGTFTDASVFQKKADFDSYLFGAYTELQDYSALNGIIVPGFVSQDLVAVDEKPKVLPSYLTPGNGDISAIWGRLYKTIGRANLVIDKLTTASGTLTDADKTKLDGDAKFLRGYAYFLLTRAFGSIPMPLTPYDAAQNSMECTAEDQAWNQVIKDLTDAAQKLPRRADWGADNLGRASKGSALAYLANAQMYKKAWAEATKASQDLVALGDYKLLPDVRTVFSAKTDNNDESIFEMQYRRVENGNYVWSGQPNNGNLLNEWTSPRNVGDTYAPFNGWGETIMSRKLADSFEPGDQRRAKLVVVPGETYQGEAMSKAVTIPLTITQNKSAFSTKYWLGTDEAYLGGQNLPQMRYAEFLLNYAEILFESGKTAEAYQQLNAVRKRVGLPDRPVQSDKEVFLTALMKERRWELNFEPNLWFHYTRTGRAGKFISEEYGLTFNPAWNKFPIPQADRDQNPKLCQNSGY